MLTAITGINWGDEGKGRMVDLISQEYDIVARYQGGNNAGHTVKNERGKFVLNLLPSGILRPDVVCVMGNGMVIDPHHLDGEINKLREQGISITPENLKISDRATITMPYHVAQDGLEEARLSKTGAQFGSTKRGIAYAYGDKYMKKTLRMGDLLHLDESVKKRLVTMVDSKNLVMEGSYNAEPIRVMRCGHGWKSMPPSSRITSAMWASTWPMQMPPGRRSCSRPSWALCATSTSASTPTPLLPTSSVLMLPSAQASRATSCTTPSAS